MLINFINDEISSISIPSTVENIPYLRNKGFRIVGKNYEKTYLHWSNVRAYDELNTLITDLNLNTISIFQQGFPPAFEKYTCLVTNNLEDNVYCVLSFYNNFLNVWENLTSTETVLGWWNKSKFNPSTYIYSKAQFVQYLAPKLLCIPVNSY